MNNGVADKVRHNAAKDLQRELCELQKLFDNLFNDVMSHRTKLVNAIFLHCFLNCM